MRAVGHVHEAPTKLEDQHLNLESLKHGLVTLSVEALLLQYTRV